MSCWICEKVVKPFKKVLHKTPPFKKISQGKRGKCCSSSAGITQFRFKGLGEMLFSLSAIHLDSTPGLK